MSFDSTAWNPRGVMSCIFLVLYDSSYCNMRATLITALGWATYTLDTLCWMSMIFCDAVLQIPLLCKKRQTDNRQYHIKAIACIYYRGIWKCTLLCIDSIWNLQYSINMHIVLVWCSSGRTSVFNDSVWFMHLYSSGLIHCLPKVIYLSFCPVLVKWDV